MEIKKYLPIAEKKLLIDTIVTHSLTENENGLKMINYIQKDVAQVIMIIRMYTDMEVNLDNYDELVESGKFNEIVSSIVTSDIDFVIKTVDKILEQEVKINNSIEGIISSNLTKLISKIPNEKQINKFIPKLMKSLEKISPEIVDTIKNISKGTIKESKAGD